MIYINFLSLQLGQDRSLVWFDTKLKYIRICTGDWTLTTFCWSHLTVQSHLVFVHYNIKTFLKP